MEVMEEAEEEMEEAEEEMSSKELAQSNFLLYFAYIK